MKKQLGLFSVCLIILIPLIFTACDDPTDPEGERKWTYMVYLGADNNLSTAGVQDIGEMGKVGSTSEVAIAVQAEFSPKYTEGIRDTSTVRLLVEEGDAVDNINAAENIGNVDMGSPAALTDFIKWAAETYPAENYALILWDHGAGWKQLSADAGSSLFRGAMQDETAGSFMSLSDLAAAVRDSGVKIDLINFDACLMAMYEVAYEFKGLTDYMVFSEETEPGDGDPYDTILSDLTDDPDMSAGELATVIVKRYDESYVSFVEQHADQLTTKSAMDMAQLDKLDTAICALGQALMNDPGANTVAMAARSNTQHYAYPANHDIYELASYIDQNAPAGSAKTAAAEVMTAVEDVVTANAANPDADEAHNVGLAIYLPSASETNAEELGVYAQLACNTTSREPTAGSWGQFVDWEIKQDGGGTGSYGPGGYNLRVEWAAEAGGACDADLDLLVVENGDLYSPATGQTTPNGHFSPDSAVSGVSSEYYQANNQVQTGYYHFMIRYYEDGSNCDKAEAEMFLNDQSQGSATLDLSKTYKGTNDEANCDAHSVLYDYLKCIGDNYTDFVYLGYVEVTPAALSQLLQEAGDSKLPAGTTIKQFDLMHKDWLKW